MPFADGGMMSCWEHFKEGFIKYTKCLRTAFETDILGSLLKKIRKKDIS